MIGLLAACAADGNGDTTADSGGSSSQESGVLQEDAALDTADPTPTIRLEPAPQEESEVPASPTAMIAELPTEPPPEPSPTSTPIPTATIPPVMINGLPSGNFIIMPEEARANVREIAATGQAMGRNPNALSILGDSLIDTPQSLAQWDQGTYVLGAYDFLQPTIDQYVGSFGRYGVSVRVGLHSWSVFDPLWADKDFCQANEDLLTCELRLNNPSVMFVFLGSNDSGSPGGFNVNYRQVMDTLIANGVVPILATKADRFEGPDNANNTIIRKIAAEYQLPLMEFDILADTLPGRGLGPDNIHLTFLEPLDYSNSEIFAVGYPIHNLASLMILDEVRREMSGSEN